MPQRNINNDVELEEIEYDSEELSEEELAQLTKYKSPLTDEQDPVENLTTMEINLDETLSPDSSDSDPIPRVDTPAQTTSTLPGPADTQKISLVHKGELAFAKSAPLNLVLEDIIENEKLPLLHALLDDLVKNAEQGAFQEISCDTPETKAVSGLNGLLKHLENALKSIPNQPEWFSQIINNDGFGTIFGMIEKYRSDLDNLQKELIFESAPTPTDPVPAFNEEKSASEVEVKPPKLKKDDFEEPPQNTLSFDDDDELSALFDSIDLEAQDEDPDEQEIFDQEIEVADISEMDLMDVIREAHNQKNSAVTIEHVFQKVEDAIGLFFTKYGYIKVNQNPRRALFAVNVLNDLFQDIEIVHNSILHRADENRFYQEVAEYLKEKIIFLSREMKSYIQILKIPALDDLELTDDGKLSKNLTSAIFKESTLNHKDSIDIFMNSYIENLPRDNTEKKITLEQLLNEMVTTFNDNHPDPVREKLTAYFHLLLDYASQNDELFSVLRDEFLEQKEGELDSYINMKTAEALSTNDPIGRLQDLVAIIGDRKANLSVFAEPEVDKSLEDAKIRVFEEITAQKCKQDPLFGAIHMQINNEDTQAIENYASEEITKYKKDKNSACAKLNELISEIDLKLSASQYLDCPDVKESLLRQQEVLKEEIYRIEHPFKSRISNFSKSAKSLISAGASKARGIGSWFNKKVLKPAVGLGSKLVSGIWNGVKAVGSWFKRHSKKLIFAGATMAMLFVGGKIAVNQFNQSQKKGVSEIGADETPATEKMAPESNITDNKVEAEEAENFSISEDSKKKYLDSMISGISGFSEESNQEETENVDEDTVYNDDLTSDGNSSGSETSPSSKEFDPIPDNGTMWDLAKNQRYMSSLSVYERCAVIRIKTNEVTGEDKKHLWVKDGEQFYGPESEAEALKILAENSELVDTILDNHKKNRQKVKDNLKKGGTDDHAWQVIDEGWDKIATNYDG